jgi:hypothetical protein
MCTVRDPAYVQSTFHFSPCTLSASSRSLASKRFRSRTVSIQTQLFTLLQQKNSRGVKLGLPGGHRITPANSPSKKCCTVRKIRISINMSCWRPIVYLFQWRNVTVLTFTTMPFVYLQTEPPEIPRLLFGPSVFGKLRGPSSGCVLYYTPLDRIVSSINQPSLTSLLTCSSPFKD